MYTSLLSHDAEEGSEAEARKANNRASTASDVTRPPNFFASSSYEKVKVRPARRSLCGNLIVSNTSKNVNAMTVFCFKNGGIVHE